MQKLIRITVHMYLHYGTFSVHRVVYVYVYILASPEIYLWQHDQHQVHGLATPSGASSNNVNFIYTHSSVS
jgi:hypothetical protein